MMLRAHFAGQTGRRTAGDITAMRRTLINRGQYIRHDIIVDPGQQRFITTRHHIDPALSQDLTVAFFAQCQYCLHLRKPDQCTAQGRIGSAAQAQCITAGIGFTLPVPQTERNGTAGSGMWIFLRKGGLG